MDGDAHPQRFSAPLASGNMGQSGLRHRLNTKTPPTSYSVTERKLGENMFRLRKACALAKSIFIAFLNELASLQFVGLSTSGFVAVWLFSRLVLAFLIVAVRTSGSRSPHVHLLDEVVELDVS